MKDVFPLVLGAIGAIIAIFLKEAVQQALQRRVIAWQLFGYLISWKARIVRADGLIGLYFKVKERDDNLTQSFSRGTAAARAVWDQQSKERDELRSAIRDGVEKAFSAQGPYNFEQFTLTAVQHAVTSISRNRSLLEDSKTFISDKDAALLGRQIALNSIQFRTSLLTVMIAFEALLQMAPIEGEHRAAAIAYLIDQIVVEGEAAMIAFVRLEKDLDRLTIQGVPLMAWNVIRGR